MTKQAAPTGPVHRAMAKALADRYNHLGELGKQLLKCEKALNESPITASEFEKYKGFQEEFKRLLHEIIELWSWVTPEVTRKPSEADVRECIRYLAERNIGAQLVPSLVKEGLGGSPGRPATKRREAIRALELRTENPKRWPWRKVVKELCDCTKREHDYYCEESMKAQVGRLKRLLRECGIDFKHIWNQETQT